MMIVVAIITCALCAGVIYGTLVYLKKQAAVSVGAERQKMIQKIEKVSAELDAILKYSNSYISKSQYDNLLSRVESLKSDYENEKKNLQELEAKLDSSQNLVEEKEGQQQELKTAKEEDEIKLEELLGSYQDISDEAISLEQALAESMKNLDVIKNEVDMTAEQKEVVDQLEDALSAAGKNMRNLLMEYQTVKERLELLKEQHNDLEEEYTKLVEQQLGE